MKWTAVFFVKVLVPAVDCSLTSKTIMRAVAQGLQLMILCLVFALTNFYLSDSLSGNLKLLILKQCFPIVVPRYPGVPFAILRGATKYYLYFIFSVHIILNMSLNNQAKLLFAHFRVLQNILLKDAVCLERLELLLSLGASGWKCIAECSKSAEGDLHVVSLSFVFPHAKSTIFTFSVVQRPLPLLC